MPQLPKQDRYCMEVLQETKENVKAGNRTGSDVQYSVSATVKPNEAVEAPARKTDKKTPDEQYSSVLAVLETDEVLFLKKKNFQISLIIGINMSPVHLIVCVFNTDAGPDLIGATILDPVPWTVSANVTGCTSAMQQVRS